MSERTTQRLSPRPAGSDTRLTATPDSAVFVNQTSAAHAAEESGKLDRWLSQIEGQQGIAMSHQEPEEAAIPAPESSAGEHEAANPVNHAQVLVPQDTPSEFHPLLANLGVNLTPAPAGRKHVFDEFLRGRLVSLLALGLSIRQAAAAIGVSHVAVWKEMKRNPDLTEQVNAARFQAQIEPLLVILRESKRSWRAATWLIKYLGVKIKSREETPDEADERLTEHSRRFREEAHRPPPPQPVDPDIARWAAQAEARRAKSRKWREAKKAAQQAAQQATAASEGAHAN
jgi:hypothetical protein